MNKNPIFMQFASKFAVFQIFLDKIHIYFCVPFPLMISWATDLSVHMKHPLHMNLFIAQFVITILNITGIRAGPQMAI